MAKNAVEEMEATAEATMADLQRQMKAIQSDISAITGTLKTFGKDQAGHVSAAARNAFDHAGEGLRMTAAEARERGEHIAEEVEQTISRNPLTSVLVALGVGYIAGMMARH
ncbi:MAG: DUF883 family protein [Bauldia sp.]|nr:DUF883 family protein [Bauldia sp.]